MQLLSVGHGGFWDRRGAKDREVQGIPNREWSLLVRSKMNANHVLPLGLFVVLGACTQTRPVDPRQNPGSAALATGEPAGGESAPIAGRVDLPPQQPRR